jgi:hypothetical protein
MLIVCYKQWKPDISSITEVEGGGRTERERERQTDTQGESVDESLYAG